MRCCRSWARFLLGPLLACSILLAVAAAHAGSIEPLRAELKAGEDGQVLSAEFAVDLGPRLEDAVSRGVPLYFNLEFTLQRQRWYWVNESVASILINYRLAYNALTRQYRLSFGGLHQSFSELSDALRVISRVSALPVADKGALKAGEVYAAALRLSLDRNQLPKPLQVDAIANSDWQVSSKALHWQFVAPAPNASPAATAPPTAPAQAGLSPGPAPVPTRPAAAAPTLPTAAGSSLPVFVAPPGLVVTPAPPKEK